MPTLNLPARSSRTRFSLPVGPGSHSSASAVADEIVTSLSPNATGGNTIQDHLADLIARSGHGQATQYATGTAYDVGAEVYWVDSQNTTHFYLRLVAGQDTGGSTPNNLPTMWREVVNNLGSIPVDGDISTSAALLEKQQGHGAVRASVPLYERLIASQTSSDVTSAITTWVKRIVDQSTYKGDWAHGVTYAAGDIVESGNTLYRRKTAGSDSAGQDPARNTTDWSGLAGLELAAAQRLKAIHDLPEAEEFRGTFSSITAGAALRVGDVVRDDHGRWFIRRTDGTKGSTNPASDLTNWKLLTLFSGAYSGTRAYPVGSLVTQDGALWIAPQDIAANGRAPDSGASPWQLITSRGRFRGDWNTLAGKIIFQGDVMIHSSDAYLCVEEHLRADAGPDTDSTNFILLTNVRNDPDWNDDGWYHGGTFVLRDGALYLAREDVTSAQAGPTPVGDERWLPISMWRGIWGARSYSAGIMVAHEGHLYVSGVNIDRLDPAPGSSADTKWIAAGSLHGGGNFEPSPSVGHDADDRAAIQNPGKDGVWGAPSTLPRGSSTHATVAFESSRPSDSAASASLSVGNIPAVLEQFFTRVVSTGRIKVTDHPPDATQITLRTTWSAPLPPAITSVNIKVLHAGSQGRETLLNVTPTIPADASSSNLYTLTTEYTGRPVYFRKGGTLWVEYTGFDGHENAGLGILNGCQLDLEVDGEPIDATKYDSYPVQTRPIRDAVSIDTRDPTEVAYTADNLRFNNNVAHGHSIKNSVGPTVGNGWRITNTHTRGEESNTTDIIVTADSTNLAVKFSADIGFNDRSNDPQNPDQLRCMIGVLTDGTSDDGEFGNHTELTFVEASDLIQHSGQISTGSTHYNATPVITQWTIDEALQGGFIEIGTGTPDHPVETYIKFDPRGDAQTLNVGLSGSVITDPGDLQITLQALDGNNQERTGSGTKFSFRLKSRPAYHTPTTGSPFNFAIHASDAIHNENTNWRWVVRLEAAAAGNSIDIDALRDLNLDVEWTGTYDAGKSVTMSLPSHTFNNGDRIGIFFRNETDTTHSRILTVENIKWSVQNADAAQGRTITATGILNGRQEVELGTMTSDPGPWWILDDDKRIHASRDARSALVTVSVPPRTRPVEVTLWRSSEELTSREALGPGPLLVRPGTDTFQMHGETPAIVTGEFFVVTCSEALTGTWTVSAEAKTGMGHPPVQVRTEGLLHTRKIVDGNLPAGGNSAAWRRVPQILPFSWGAVRVLHCMMRDSFYFTVWNSFQIHTSELHEIPALAVERLDSNYRRGTDHCLAVHLAQTGINILVAPLDDGGIAIARGNVHDQLLKIWAE